MQLQIGYQRGIIGLNINKGQFQLDSKQPSMELKPTKPSVTLDISQPQIKIDQREQFDQLGKRFPLSMAKHYTNKGRSISTQGIARRVSEGRKLADIHQPVDIGQLTAAREQVPRQRKLSIEALPKSRPKIDFITNEPKAYLVEGKVNGNLRYGEVSLNAKKGHVSVYWLQKPDVNVDYLGRAIDFAI